MTDFSSLGRFGQAQKIALVFLSNNEVEEVVPAEATDADYADRIGQTHRFLVIDKVAGLVGSSLPISSAYGPQANPNPEGPMLYVHALVEPQTDCVLVEVRGNSLALVREAYGHVMMSVVRGSSLHLLQRESLL